MASGPQDIHTKRPNLFAGASEVSETDLAEELPAGKVVTAAQPVVNWNAPAAVLQPAPQPTTVPEPAAPVPSPAKPANGRPTFNSEGVKSRRLESAWAAYQTELNRWLEQRIRERAHLSFTATVMSSKGGVGKTGTSIEISTVLAEFIRKVVTIVDANPSSADDVVIRLLGGACGRTWNVYDAFQNTDLLGTYASSIGAQPVTIHGVSVVGSAPSVHRDSITRKTIADFAALFDRVKQQSQVLVIDTGTELPHPATTAAASVADVAVFVTRAGQEISWEHCALTIDWYRDRHAIKMAGTVIVVVDSDTGRHNEFIEAFRSTGITRIIEVPSDAAIGADKPLVLSNLQPGTYRQLLELANAVLDAAEAWHDVRGTL